MNFTFPQEKISLYQMPAKCSHCMSELWIKNTKLILKSINPTDIEHFSTRFQLVTTLYLALFSGSCS